VSNAASLARVRRLAGQPARIALGAFGLVLLFTLGYQISMRRRHPAAA